MFTPPPSPQPSRTDGFHISASILEPSTEELDHLEKIGDSNDIKRRAGRRFLWAVVLIPFILIAFTIFGGFPTSLVRNSTSVFSSPPPLWYGLESHKSIWKKREPHPQPIVSPSSSTPSTSPTSTSSSSGPVVSQILPTVPSSPPILPTPFPQAFDGIITQNFTTSSCLNFFNNMTASMDFRSCRPFSFLSSTSSTFINAQNNLTLMNTLIWGTCNTTISDGQCNSNMASFASQIQSDCSQELGNQNLLVVKSLTALQAFQVMHDSACLVDPSTNAYCYLSAVQNPNPSDLYFYSLPLGIPLPNTSKPSCSACSKNIMKIYSTALQDPTQSKTLTGLTSSYGISAQIAAQFCGSAFAFNPVSAALSRYYRCGGGGGGWKTMLTSLFFTIAWTVLGYFFS